MLAYRAPAFLILLGSAVCHYQSFGLAFIVYFVCAAASLHCSRNDDHLKGRRDRTVQYIGRQYSTQIRTAVPDDTLALQQHTGKEKQGTTIALASSAQNNTSCVQVDVHTRPHCRLRNDGLKQILQRYLQAPCITLCRASRRSTDSKLMA